MGKEIKYISEDEKEIPKFNYCIKPDRNIINKKIYNTLDEISILEKKLNELKLFFKNAKEWKTIQFTSILGIMTAYITFMSTYSFVFDDATRILVLTLSLFSGTIATGVSAIVALGFVPNKTEQFLIKHFDYIKKANDTIQELSKEIEEKEDYLLELNIILDSLVTGNEIINMENEKKQVYEFRKLFCDNLTLTNFTDEKNSKKVKRKVRVPKDN